jgi:hypothetical protein
VREIKYYVQTYLDKLINRPRTTARRCSQHGLAIPWLTSEWPGSFIHMPKTFTVMAVHCRNVVIGLIIKWLGQLIKRCRTHSKLHFAPLFKWKWRFLRIIRQCFFETEGKRSCMLFTPALSEVKLSDEDNRVKEERNILHLTRRLNANWICHRLCIRRFLKHIFWRNDRNDEKTRTKT